MPEIDAGRFPAKRAVGETVRVEADIFADGHDALAAVVKYKLLPARGEEVPPPHSWGGAGRSPAEGLVNGLVGVGPPPHDRRRRPPDRGGSAGRLPTLT